MLVRSLPMILAWAMLGCRPTASSAAPAPVTTDRSSPSAPAPDPQRDASVALASTPAAATNPPAGPITVMDIADLVDDARQHDGNTVTLRARAEAQVSGCTSSVPPSCWGTLALRDVEGRKSFPVELRGDWAGAEIRCAFDTGTAPPDPRAPESNPKPTTTVAAAGRDGGTCSPNINDRAIYEITGVLVFTGGGFTMQPTAINTAP